MNATLRYRSGRFGTSRLQHHAKPVSRIGRMRTRISAQVPDLEGKRVLIIGGTGRVGSSAASALLKSFSGINISLASRSSGSYDQAVQLRPELKQTKFLKLDINNADSVKVCTDGQNHVLIITQGKIQSLLFT